MAENSKKYHNNNDSAVEVAAKENVEKVVFVNRCSKVVKGGRRFSFSALIVTGDLQGKVGVGFGKANEVSEAIRKASEAAKRSMIKVAITDHTIPHEVIGEHGGGRVLLRPASPGTGIIAGGGVRAVVEAAGVRDVLAKSLGSNNHANVVHATIEALKQLRHREEIFKLRGKKYTPSIPKNSLSEIEQAGLTQLELPAAEKELELPPTEQPILIPESFPEDQKDEECVNEQLVAVSGEIQEVIQEVASDSINQENPEEILGPIQSVEVVLEESSEEELDASDPSAKKEA